MDYSEIRLMIGKYWDCETSVEEEELLKRFFREHTGPLPDDLKEAGRLFLYLREEGQKGMNDARLEVSLKNIPLTVPPGRPGRVISFRQRIGRYAAAVAVVAGIAVYFALKQGAVQNSGGARPVAQDTYTDPDKAFAATKAALMLISANLNKGKEGMQKLALFDEAQKKVSEGK